MNDIISSINETLMKNKRDINSISGKWYIDALKLRQLDINITGDGEVGDNTSSTDLKYRSKGYLTRKPDHKTISLSVNCMNSTILYDFNGRVTITGDNNIIIANAQNSTYMVTGDHNEIISIGDNSNLVINGNNNKIISYFNGNCITIAGNKNEVLLIGKPNMTTVNLSGVDNNFTVCERDKFIKESIIVGIPKEVIKYQEVVSDDRESYRKTAIIRRDIKIIDETPFIPPNAQ